MRIAPAALAVALAGCVGPPTHVPPPAARQAPPPIPLYRPVSESDVLLQGQAVQGGLVMGKASPGIIGLTLDGAKVALAPDGRFILGFDRDAATDALLVATSTVGHQFRRTIAVAQRDWRIERVDTPYHAGRTSAEFDRLRPIERAAIDRARAIPVESDGWRRSFEWPVHGRQSGWFGSQRVYQGKPGSFHGGADVAVPTGTPVRAPADGVVILASDHPYTLEGNLLMVAHGHALDSAFLHLSRIAVATGDRVRQGDVIAYSGATGRATGPHLHWGVTWSGARLDPLLVAGPVAPG